MQAKYQVSWMKYKAIFQHSLWGKLTDISDYNVLWSLDEYLKAGHVKFNTNRKELYRLSILIENYAARNKEPLLATFETEKRYMYVKDRYVELLEKSQTHGLSEILIILTWLLTHQRMLKSLVVMAPAFPICGLWLPMEKTGLSD